METTLRENKKNGQEQLYTKEKSFLRDFLTLAVIVTFVFISLPVSVTGNQSVINYFIAQQTLKTIIAPENCLSEKASCEIMLSDNEKIIISMPHQVSSIYPFNVLVKMSNTDVSSVKLLFKGVEHNHGLRELAMSKINDESFKVQGLLGYCGFGKMNWNAMMTVYTAGQAYQIIIPFQSIDPKVS